MKSKDIGKLRKSYEKKYIDDIKNKILFSGKETLSKVDRYNEYLMTGLRTVWGVSLDLLESDFGEKFKNHLKSNGIKYSDWGETAVAGWKQIFFYDPDGNIIEVHEKEVS